jgi:hypothetical protein
MVAVVETAADAQDIPETGKEILHHAKAVFRMKVLKIWE